ncbi:MAG: DUF3795 domain-containing protein [Roseburia sp.]|jgi:hypothetical protein|nr:DUF3795 domain-containing protein [Roseburia sp.]
MSGSICGVDCSKCEWKNGCSGCAETDGCPFGGTCVVARCLQKKEQTLKEFEKKLIAAFNALQIEDMDEVTELNALPGFLINLAYTLPGGDKVKFWDEQRVYLGNQLCKHGSDNCYGLVADEQYLMVCEYGENGSNPALVVFQRWNQTEKEPLKG